MKRKFTLIIALGALLLCSSCSKSDVIEHQEASSNASEHQEASSQNNYESDDDFIEVVAGDFVFCIPEDSELTDSSTDEVINLKYSIKQDESEYNLFIISADKETGQKIHNDTVDFMNNYSKKISEFDNLATDSTEEIEMPLCDIQKVDIDSIGGVKTSLSTGWLMEMEDYSFILVSCFANGKYYSLQYTTQSFDPAVWDDFLNNIRPL